MQPSDILHVILTRFNLPSGGREKRIRQSKNWLKNRFELFETYCLPSVLHQSNKNYRWHIYLDKDTPEPYRQRALKIAQEQHQIRLFWARSISIHEISQQILSEQATSKKIIITTRLDNDDALNQDFIDKIQRSIISNSDIAVNSVLNFTNGLIFNRDHLYAHTDKSNAFVSLVEPVSENLQTIWKHQHTQLQNFGRVIQLNDPAMWVQIIHSNNISNRVRGYRVASSKLRYHFPTIEYNKNESAIAIAVENLAFYPLRRFKEFLRAKLKPLFFYIKSRY